MKSSRQLPPAPRAFSIRPVHCLAILVAMLVLFFSKILLGNAFLWEDFLYFNYPLRVFASTSLASGEIPLWNPYTFSGMPFLADIQTAVFYLPLTLLTLFVHQGTLNPYWLELVIIAHYLLAGAGMVLLARSFKVDMIPALVAGASYMLSGFMITHAIHQQMITLVAWYPLIVYLFRRALAENGWRWTLLTGLVLGHSVFAGYPQLSLYLYVLLLAIGVYDLFSTYRGKAIVSTPALFAAGRGVAIALISIAVAAIQLLPTLELSGLSQRAEISYAKSAEGSLAWSQLLTLIYPKFFGTAGPAGYNYWGPGTYWYFWETCIYVGIIPLLLALLALLLWKKQRYVGFFAGYALFTILYALGDHFFLHKLIYDYVPGFSTFRIPARMSVFLALSLSLLGAFSLHAMLQVKKDVEFTRRALMMLVSITVLGAAVGLLVVAGTFNDAFHFLQNQAVFATVRKEVFLSLLILLASAALLFLLLRRAGMHRVARILLLPMLFIDLFIFGGGQNNSSVDPRAYFGRAEPLVRFFHEQGKKELFRVNTRNANGLLMDRNQSMVDRIFTMEGYTPLALQRVYAPLPANKLFDLMNAKYTTVTDTARQALTLAENPTYFPRAFVLYDLHVVRSEIELMGYMQSAAFDHRKTAVFEEDPGITPANNGGTGQWQASFVSYRSNSMTLDVSTDRQGVLVLSEIYFPGWNAYIDGEQTRVFRVDYNLRGVILPAGAHRVDVRFEPASFARGRTISIVAVLLCLIGIGAELLWKNPRWKPARLFRKSDPVQA